MTYQVVEVDLDRLDGAVTWSDGALVVGRRDGLPVAAALIDGAPPSSTSAIADRLTRRLAGPCQVRARQSRSPWRSATRPAGASGALPRLRRGGDGGGRRRGLRPDARRRQRVGRRAHVRCRTGGGARVVVEPVAGLDAGAEPRPVGMHDRGARLRRRRRRRRPALAANGRPDVRRTSRRRSRRRRRACVHARHGAQLEFERGGGFFLGWEAQRLDDDSRRDYPFNASIGVGCNMAFRLEALERAGPFDEALDAPGMPGGGDLDILTRVALSSPVDYEPSAMVFHEHRRTERSSVASTARGDRRGQRR